MSQNVISIAANVAITKRLKTWPDLYSETTLSRWCKRTTRKSHDFISGNDHQIRSAFALIMMAIKFIYNAIKMRASVLFVFPLEIPTLLQWDKRRSTFRFFIAMVKVLVDSWMRSNNVI